MDSSTEAVWYCTSVWSELLLESTAGLVPNESTRAQIRAALLASLDEGFMGMIPLKKSQYETLKIMLKWSFI